MLHILNEENSMLKNRKFPIPDGIRKFLNKTLRDYNGSKTIDGYKRLNNILSMQALSYAEMKRIKNFFDNYNGTKNSSEYILNGGDAMKTWVNNTLNTATKAIKDFKTAKKNSGINNSFRREHDKNRQNKKKNKPTMAKFDTNSTNLINNKTIRYENKTIVINKHQYQTLINEAMKNGFSLENLSQLKHFNAQYNYCIKYLGKPIGKGSSRVVFQIDDERVLKLGFNAKGVAQNEVEYRNSNDEDIFPKIYDNDSDFKWLITEYVLPAKAQDFKHCLNMSFKDFVKFIITSYKNRTSSVKYFDTFQDDEYVDLIENNDQLYWIDDYIANYEPPMGDMIRIANYGMTLRQGQPTIVILDNGLDQNTFNKFY